MVLQASYHGYEKPLKLTEMNLENYNNIKNCRGSDVSVFKFVIKLPHHTCMDELSNTVMGICGLFWAASNNRLCVCVCAPVC